MDSMQLWNLPEQEARVHLKVPDWKNKHNWVGWRDSDLERVNSSSSRELWNKITCSAMSSVGKGRDVLGGS